jgi:hypothetical protein
MKVVPANPVAALYSAAALRETPRLLSLLDRQPHSATYGSFDREHWGWKFRDFALGMQQTAAYPLALLWRHPFATSPYHRNDQLLRWIFAAIDQTLSRQHENGAFDAFAPNEQDPGPTLGVLHGLLEAWRLVGDEAPAPLAGRFRTAVRKACDFSMRREETEVHAFVSNHWALFAVALLEAAQLLGEERYRRRAAWAVARVLREQSPDGWYNEYGGPDPGYESLGIFHLAVFWRRTGSQELLPSLRRSVEFYAHCVHPDGSVGGCYGSRHTSLYFPGGFEILADQVPAAAAVAGYLRERLARGNVLTPASSDAENLPSLCYAYLEAAIAADRPSAPPQPGKLPCVCLRGTRHFAGAGLSFVGKPAYYAVVHGKRGGLCRMFDKRDEKLAYEDSGYVIDAAGRRWSSQFLGLGSLAPGNGEELDCATVFAEVRPLVPTPARFVLLRLLNLTLFRSLALGAWLRSQIVSRLILARRRGPFRMRRKVRFEENGVRLDDQLVATAPVQVEEVELPRSFLAIHMGSAKYFHPAELEATQSAPLAGVARALNTQRSAQVSFQVEFAAPETNAHVARLATEDSLTR